MQGLEGFTARTGSSFPRAVVKTSKKNNETLTEVRGSWIPQGFENWEYKSCLELRQKVRMTLAESWKWFRERLAVFKVQAGCETRDFS